MFPNRAPVPPGSGSSYKLSIPETCDRIKEEFSYFQQQTHNFHVEREKIIQERSEMQRLCIMYYEMAHGLNLEMHRQMEIAKRLNAILNQLIPYLSQEHQGQISTAIERAKQVTMQELNSAMMHTEEAKCSKFFNGGNFGFPDQLEFYKHMLNAAATLNPSGGSSTVTSGGSSSASGFPLPSPAPLMSNSLSGGVTSVPPQVPNVPPLPPVSAGANASTLAAGAASFFANLMASGTSGFSQNALAANAALAGNPAAANFFLNASSGQQLNPNNLNLASALLKQEADKHMNDDKQKDSNFSRPPSANDKLHNLSRDNLSNHISEVHEKRRKLDMKIEHKEEDEHYDDKRCNTFNGNGKLKDNEWRHMDNLPISPRSVGSSTPGLNKKKSSKNALDLSQGPGANSSNDGYPTTCSAPTTPATGSLVPVGSRSSEVNNLSTSKSKNHSGKSLSQSSSKKHYNYVVKPNGSLEPRLMPIDTITNSNQYPQHLRHLASFNHGEVVCAVAMHQQTVFSGGKGTLKLWDINENVIRGSSSPASRDPVASLSCLNSDSYIRSIKLINGSAAVIGGETNIIDIWDMAASGTPIKKGEVKIDAPACYALTVAPDGKTCFSCFSDGNIAMIDIHNQTVINQFQAHVEGASCIEISSDGTYLWTGGLDSAVRAWDIRDCGRELKTIEFHAQIFSIGLTSTKDNRFVRPGYDWLAVGLENSDIDLVRVSPLEISVPPPQEHFRLQLHDNCVLSLRFAHHNDWFITTSKDHLINAITCPSGINILQTKEAGSVLTSDISSDDKYVVTGSGDRKATLYDVVYPNSDC